MEKKQVIYNIFSPRAHRSLLKPSHTNSSVCSLGSADTWPESPSSAAEREFLQTCFCSSRLNWAFHSRILWYLERSLLRCKGHRDPSRQQWVLISTVPGQRVCRMVEVDGDLSSRVSWDRLSKTSWVFNISIDGEFRRNPTFSCAPVVTRAVVILIFHWMLLRSVRVSHFPFATAQQDIPQLYHSKYNIPSQRDETFSGKGVITGKTLDYRAVPTVCSIFPNIGKNKQVFYFLFQHEKYVNCSWEQRIKNIIYLGDSCRAR